MTSSESRALRHAAVLVLGLGLLRAGVESVRSPMTTGGSSPPDSSGLEALLKNSRESRDEARRRTRPLEGGERIDPNTAGEVDLDRLPGVGPAVAERIVRTRAERGPFAAPDDLLAVPGVGPATLARITPHLEWSAGPRPGPPPGSRSGASTSEVVPVDINRAGREELERLPGVGPVMAERILIFREEVGRIRELEDLEAVRGIGPAMINRLRPFVITGS